LLEDGSSADPASLGIAVMLAGASEQVGGDVIGGVNYSTAAQEEVQYQLYNVPRVSFIGRGMSWDAKGVEWRAYRCSRSPERLVLFGCYFASSRDCSTMG